MEAQLTGNDVLIPRIEFIMGSIALILKKTTGVKDSE